MPNHVTNEIKIIGTEARIKELLEKAHVKYMQLQDRFDIPQGQEPKLEEVEREFSFRGFVPVPDHPDYQGNCSHQHPSPGMADFIRQQFGMDLPDDHPIIAASLVKEEHPNCWYVWNRENWGTKWDAYDVVIGSESTILERLATAGDERVTEVVRFDTAWSPPFPIFEKIAQEFSDCDFVFSWLDEDMMGHGGGYVEFKDGKFGEVVSDINDPEDPETGKLWWELAKNLKGYSWEKYQDRLDEIAEDERLTAEREASQEA